MYHQSKLTALLWLGAAAAVSASCSKVSFKIAAVSQSSIFQNPPDPNDEASVINFVETALSSTGQPIIDSTSVGGTFDISGTFCKPAKGSPERDTLLLYVHGATYNGSMWSGLSFDDMYNWPLFASKNGYYTLAIDRLGHGDSPQRPDPINVAQEQLNVEIIHQIILQIQTGRTSLASASGFGHLVYIGHSYGSFMGNSMARLYPQDCDAYILTGYSASVPFPVPIINLDFRSAQTVSPRFSKLTPGYIAASSEEGRTRTFYTGAFDPAVAHLDFLGQDTGTAGEAATQAEGFQPAGFTGPVLIITGRNDIIFCAEEFGSCEDVLQQTNALFPNSSYSFFIPENTGHTLTLHFSAPSTFNFANGWLNQVILA